MPKNISRGSIKLIKGVSRIEICSQNVENEENKEDKHSILTEEEKGLLNQFGHHTIEALLIHILSCVFWGEHTISVASLVERIENSIRKNAEIIATLHQENAVKCNALLPPRAKGVGIRYPFGVALVEFLIERGLVTIIEKDKNPKMRSKKNKTSFYREKSLHVKCMFDPAILPVQMNLTMVHPPREWGCDCPPGKKWVNISDLTGGYLSSVSSMYTRYKLLSTWDITNQK